MKMKITIAVVLIALFAGSCDDAEPLEIPMASVEELEAIVKGNCVTLLEAVEAFTTENDGFYPTSIDSDTTVTGRILLDYLPGGERLINPFTGLRDQPIGTVPTSPGDIGFHKYSGLYPYNIYFIQGYGAGAMIYEEDSIAECEALVIEACQVLHFAVNMWHEDNGGMYPANSVDTNALGKTLTDYLPGGVLMRNPFTMLRTEPVFATAATRGQVGYVATYSGSDPVGYTVTGNGFDDGTIVHTIAVEE